MRSRFSFLAIVMAFALLVAACGDDDAGSAPDATSGSGSPINVEDLPTNVGNIPGVSGECEALLNLFLSIGGAFLGGAVAPLDAGTLASLPAEVRADAVILSETLVEFSAGLEAAGIDLSDPATYTTMTESQQAAFSALGDSLDTPEFNAASDNLSEYGEQQCESQFGGTG